MISCRCSGRWSLRLLAPCLVALLLSCTSKAPESPAGASARPYRDLPEYACLRVVTMFLGIAVGEGDELPKVIDAFHMILDHPRAAEAFKDLLGEARLGGQLYALCGLYLTDPATFRTAVEPYRRLRTKIDACRFGCDVEHLEVATLVDLGPERRDRKSRAGDAEKKDRDGRGVPGEGAASDEEGDSIEGLDIVGGGWPELFARSRRYPPVTPERAAQADRAVQAWIQAVAGRRGDPEDGGATEIARTLGPAALPGVVRALDHEDASVRAGACWILGDIGPWAKDAAPDLARRLWDPEIDVRLAAAEALKEIGLWAGAAIPALKKKLEDGSDSEEKVGVRGAEVLEASLYALSRAGPAGASATVEAAAGLLTHPDDSLRGYAMGILSRRSKGPVLAVIPILRRHLEHAEARVRLDAAGILLRLDPQDSAARAAAAAAATVLRQLASDRDPDVAFRATQLIEDLKQSRTAESQDGEGEDAQESRSPVEDDPRPGP
jgi:hypothetical protein